MSPETERKKREKTVGGTLKSPLAAGRLSCEPGRIYGFCGSVNPLSRAKLEYSHRQGMRPNLFIYLFSFARCVRVRARACLSPPLLCVTVCARLLQLPGLQSVACHSVNSLTECKVIGNTKQPVFARAHACVLVFVCSHIVRMRPHSLISWGGDKHMNTE